MAERVLSDEEIDALADDPTRDSLTEELSSRRLQVARLQARVRELEEALKRIPCRRCERAVGGYIERSDGLIVAALFCEDCAAGRLTRAALARKEEQDDAS